ALPVTLLDFYGRYSDKTVTLNWNTEREINTKYFSVEKSFDGTSFVPLASIEAAGNMQSNTNYQYADNTSLKGTNYYQLKMVDADDRFTYSKTIAVTVPVNNAITVFPNPVKDKLFIRLAAVPAETEIIITDAKGAILNRIKLNAGSTRASINTVSLSAGVYSISIQSDKLKSTQQFIKE
ncbi:MAG: T9SS type A sorting domain-containing protein, partial [Ginsengibacter sp.]